MKILKVKYAFILLFLTITSRVKAQYLPVNNDNERYLTISYAPSIPIGIFNSYLDGKNFGGLSIEGRYFISDNVTLGFNLGWNDASKKMPRITETNGTSSISAVQTRYLLVFPLLINSHYHFELDNFIIRPYIGGAAGIYFTTYEKWIAEYLDSKRKISFGIRPEIGALIPITDNLGINLNFKYNYVFFKYNEFQNDLQYLEGNLGLFLGF